MRYFKAIIISACFIIINLFISSCHTTEPENRFAISAEDCSSTEAWIRVKGSSGSQIILKRDDKEVKRFSITENEAVIVDDSLLPNKSYTYQAIKNNEASNVISITTLDTTSHNFTWQQYTFGGDAGSCTLFDVAIIDENDIWAVGEIYVADNSENGNTFYNAVHWDGSNWELKKIPVRDFGTLVGIFPLRAIFAFSQNNIWFASYADLIKWDGEKFESKAFFMETAPFNGQINRIWGSSENNIYCVGNGGAIYVFNGQTWSKIETGTNLAIQDIWGCKDTQTNLSEIICIASDKYNTIEKKVFKITGNNVEELLSGGLPWSLSSIWFLSNREYFICGDGLYTDKNINENWKKDNSFPAIYKDRIRGNSYNDIVVSGSYGLVSHYNGYSWHHYINNELPYSNGIYYGCDIKGSTVVCVGFMDQQAVILLGKRE